MSIESRAPLAAPQSAPIIDYMVLARGVSRWASPWCHIAFVQEPRAYVARAAFVVRRYIFADYTRDNYGEAWLLETVYATVAPPLGHPGNSRPAHTSAAPTVPLTAR